MNPLNLRSRRFDLWCSLAGLEQEGLRATVAASIALLPEDMQGLFWANIGLIGGNTAMPGFRQRLCVLGLDAARPPVHPSIAASLPSDLTRTPALTASPNCGLSRQSTARSLCTPLTSES